MKIEKKDDSIVMDDKDQLKKNFDQLELNDQSFITISKVTKES